MTHDEMIAVIQAHKDGREIEYAYGGDWITVQLSDHMFDFASFPYRIKPPQIEAWGVVVDGEVQAFDKKQWAENYRVEHAKSATIIRLIPDQNWSE